MEKFACHADVKCLHRSVRFRTYVKDFSDFTHRGAAYYFVVLCFIGISIAATMNKKVS
jgi:hypothetical protein